MNTKQVVLSILKIIAGVAFIGAFAQLTIDPGYDIAPITGQTFAVLLIAYLFSWPLTLITLLCYLLFGSLGLPVFADGNSGFESITGFSGGYLWGFAIGGVLVSLLVSRLSMNNLLKPFALTALGTVVILLCGFIQLGLLWNFSGAWTSGIQPFLLGGLIKILLGGITILLIERLITESTKMNMNKNVKSYDQRK